MEGKGALELCTKLIEKNDKLKFIIFSEFGEEFTTMRKSIVDQIGEGVRKKLSAKGPISTEFIPADLGLKVRFKKDEIEILCNDKVEPLTEARVVTDFTHQITESQSEIYYRCHTHRFRK